MMLEPKRYEHTSVAKMGPMSEGEFIKAMDALGSDGWQLVSVIPMTEDGNKAAYFRREKFI